VLHSEANASADDELNLFQIWVFPKEKNIKPRYNQRTYDVNGRTNNWQVVVSPREEDKALWINQDARFALTTLEAGKTLEYKNAFSGHGVYLVVVNGSVKVGDTVLNKRDALGVYDTDSFSITASEDAELMAIEVPMN
jgi:redox-sensitive bicupin YhaK (pirin superfamily)